MTDSVLNIIPFGSDRTALVQEVGDLLKRSQNACSGYINSTRVVNICEERRGKNHSLLSWDFGLDLKDLLVLAVICQAPVALRGGTDLGKTALAEMGLNGFFGNHGEGWWKIEISRGMTIDDLVDVDLKILSESTFSDAVSGAPWLTFPGRLLDEINRAPAKLNNLLLHLIGDNRLHLRGNLAVPVGMPYAVDEIEKHYSFTIVTANEKTQDYDGVYDEDQALIRRIVLSVDLDDFPPSVYDAGKLLDDRRPKAILPRYPSMLKSVIRVYESLPVTVPCSALARLLLHYLSGGMGTCIRTRSGRMRTKLQPGICEKCHLQKSHTFCSHVGGLSEGLLLWTRELAGGIAVIRAAKVLQRVKDDCLAGRHKDLQGFMDSEASGADLYRLFQAEYLSGLMISGEDVVAAYSLVAPNHVYIDKSWLESVEAYEKSQVYAFGDIGASSWKTMMQLLSEHKNLFTDLSTNREISSKNQAAVEKLVTTVNAAMLSVILAMRDTHLPLKFQEDLSLRRTA